MGSLRAQVAADLATTLEGDWGVPVTVTDPNGKTATLQAQSGDIGVLIDPDTGIPVAGRRAHAVFRLSSLSAAGFRDIPQQASSSSGLPWRIKFNDLGGDTHEFAIRHSWPDRSLGLVVCLVEHWVP